ncbi:MAG: SRPBCC domain-containing protein [Xanthobacteraceae bacterium]|nr:SRPBCC domain-containing protein [Xanthobacteraceae bacterium]
MSKDYTVSFSVDQSPEQVFAAVNDVRGWWSEEIDGRTDTLGAEFGFHYRDLHCSTQKITELVPGRRVAWRVTESDIGFVDDKHEWKDTDIVFEIGRKGGKTELRFTHVGLVPSIECYGNCSDAWSFYINESLRDLITTGKGQPARKGD